MDDGLAFSPPGCPVRRWVTSGCVKSDATTGDAPVKGLEVDGVVILPLAAALNAALLLDSPSSLFAMISQPFRYRDHRFGKHSIRSRRNLDSSRLAPLFVGGVPWCERTLDSCLPPCQRIY